METGDITFTLGTKHMSSGKSPLFGLRSGWCCFHNLFIDIAFSLVESGQQTVNILVALTFYFNVKYING